MMKEEKQNLKTELQEHEEKFMDHRSPKKKRKKLIVNSQITTPSQNDT
jgi:hypothetical protein